MHSEASGEMLDRCLEDARGRMENPKRLTVFMFPQTWPNSGCGRGGGGIVMNAFWSAPTVVVMGDDNHFCVYHDGHFAGDVRNPGEAFNAAFQAMRLPGEKDEKAWAKIRAEATGQSSRA